MKKDQTTIKKELLEARIWELSEEIGIEETVEYLKTLVEKLTLKN